MGSTYRPIGKLSMPSDWPGRIPGLHMPTKCDRRAALLSPFRKMTILSGSETNHANEFHARPATVFLKPAELGPGASRRVSPLGKVTRTPAVLLAAPALIIEMRASALLLKCCAWNRAIAFSNFV